MDSLQQCVPAVQLLGLSSASALSAYIASFTINSIPAVLLAPSADLAARQWKNLYDRGKAVAPPLAVTTAACFGFLSYYSRGIPGRFSVSPSSLYLAAALVAPSIVPYTRMIMWNTVTALEAKATGATMEPTDADTKSLIEKWSRQSFNRALMIATSALLGGAAILAGVQ